MYSWRDRETVMDMRYAISGNRLHYSSITGGVIVYVTLTGRPIAKGVDFLEGLCEHFMKVVTTDELSLEERKTSAKMPMNVAYMLGAIARPGGRRR